MPLYKRFFKSLYAPKYIAAFRMLGIGKTIQYVFILSFILVLPACVAVFMYTAGGHPAAKKAVETALPFLMANQELMQQNAFIFIPAALFAYYVLLSFMLFFKAAVFALAGLILVYGLKRRGEYRHVFRMSVHSLTLSTLLTVLVEWTDWNFPYAYAADWLLVIGMLYLSIRWLPRKTR